jgi:hypothetical protein
MIEKKEIQKELKEVLIKLQGSTNLMKDGRYIIAYQKLNGIQQKLSCLLNKITHENNQESTS